MAVPVQADFFIADLFGAAPKDDLATMEHPVFSLSTRPDRRILAYRHNGVSVSVTPSVLGRATIFDKDILIFCVSQLMAALNAGRAVSRRVELRAHDLLVATGRETSGDAYRRLRAAFERLAGTRITTNIVVPVGGAGAREAGAKGAGVDGADVKAGATGGAGAPRAAGHVARGRRPAGADGQAGGPTGAQTGVHTGGAQITSGFGLIESWEIVRRTRTGRMARVSVTVSEWLYRAVLGRAVLTLSPDYFGLRKPLERRIYELARKHCGHQTHWTVSLALLLKKSGSASPRRVFRAMVREIATADRLPDYALDERPGDLFRFVSRTGGRAAGAGLPALDPATFETVRALAPGWDVYALEADWRAYWRRSGCARLRAPDAAFVGFAKARLARGGTP